MSGPSRALSFWHELRGDPVLPIQTKRKRYQILTRGGSVGQPTGKRDRAWGFAVRHLERLIEELNFHGMKAGRIEFVLQHYTQDYQSISRHAAERLEAPTDRFDMLVQSFQRCFAKCFLPGRLVARMHLFALDLHNAQTAQRGLF